MTVCLDIGNSRIKLGLFKDGQLADVLFINDLENLKASLASGDIQSCILSNSGDIPKGFLELLLNHTDHLIILDSKTLLPFQNTYTTPSTLGQDRVAGVAGASYLYPDQDCFVIDAGTCITYDFLSDTLVYRGGNIAPGLSMRLNAMHEKTSQLPLVDPYYNEEFLGLSTNKAIQNGALYGILNEIEYYIQRLEEKYGNFKTILTGGDAQILSSHLKREIFAQPDLVLNGLYQILLHNAQNI